MATSATEFLLELLEEEGDNTDFWSDVLQFMGTEITAFATEIPRWLREAAVEAMTAALEQPYWTTIGESTLHDIAATLTRGIEDGLSIREIAALIQEDRGPDYAHYRAVNTARTEISYMSNMGARESINQLREETGLDIRRSWGSVFGITTRAAHWAADGIQTDANDKFHFLGEDGEMHVIDAPGDPTLEPIDRCACQCFTLSDFVMDDVENDVEQASDELLTAETSHNPDRLKTCCEGHGAPGGSKYSPDQPRDELGRFGDGSSGSSSGDGADSGGEQQRYREVADEIESVRETRTMAKIKSLDKKLTKERKFAGLDEEEAKTSVLEYSKWYDKWTNEALRSGTPPEEMKDDMRERIENLTKLTEQELAESTVVYRGISDELYQAALAGQKEGAEVEMQGFVSTTLDYRRASRFGTVLLQIKAKTGFYMGDISHFDGERELLQNHKTRYRIVGGVGETTVRNHLRLTVKMKTLTLEEV